MKKITLTLGIALAFLFNARAQFTVINDFASTVDATGAEPYSSLTPSVTNDTLFGMTYGGGATAYGSVFYITSDGSVYDTLYSFRDGNDGAYPYGTLVRIGKKLYGMTHSGGMNSDGIIFSLNTDGSGFDTLHSFGWAIDHGDGEPLGSLTLAPNGTAFYGTAPYGGFFGNGYIFTINTNGTGYDTVYSFTAGTNGGSTPNGDISYSATGDTLFGMTQYGGGTNYGLIFSVKANGSGFNLMHSFSSPPDSRFPNGSLTRVGNTLYGMATNGGTKGGGNIFRINTNGTAYDSVHNFGNAIDGGGATGIPEASLTLSPSGKLYGMNYNGGPNHYGSIFVYDTKTAEYDTLYNLNYATDGGNPNYDNNITLIGDTLYGMTPGYGLTGRGTIFKFTSSAVCNMYATIDSANGTAMVTTTGGSAPYTYAWTGGGTLANMTGLTAGTYSCTVTDHHGCNQVLTTHVISTVGIQTINGNAAGISVYPNPSTGTFTIKSSVISGQLSGVEVYNMLGEKVYANYQITKSSNYQIDLTNQPNGVYLYRVISENGNLLGEGKLILQK